MKNIISLVLVLLIAMSFSITKADIVYEMTVAQDGSGNYTTIQAAIDATKAFPDKRITIYIKNGVYNEKVVVPSWNNMLSLIGEDADKTIITFNDHFKKIARGRNSTFMTYTLLVDADDFYMENVTIQNTAGPVGQAVALHVEGNRCTFKNCNILGNQDTLYVDGEHSNHFFNECTIEGTTDFIFGSATAVFSSCTILSKSNSYITAASTNQGKSFGFVLLHCNLEATKDVSEVYLGRPWRIFAKTVFLYCDMGEHIRPIGWNDWRKEEAHKTAFYAEYKSTGKGAQTAYRASWSHQLTAKDAKKYTPENILGGWVTPYLN